jgi:ureidoglycolate lyase
MTTSELLRLQAQPASPVSIAPFGRLIGRAAQLVRNEIDYYGGALSVTRGVPFTNHSPAQFSLASIRRRPLQVRYLERHFQHTQTFIPLGGKPYRVVLAPPTTGELPDLDEVRAFELDGSTALQLHIGTWHEFPFALQDDTDMIVLLTEQTSADLAQRATNGIEAFGPDLDKKDITLRLRVIIEIAP